MTRDLNNIPASCGKYKMSKMNDFYLKHLQNLFRVTILWLLVKAFI